MQSLVLYDAPQSTCSQRVRLPFMKRNLAFAEIKLDLFSGDQLRPEYLKNQPQRSRAELDPQRPDGSRLGGDHRIPE